MLYLMRSPNTQHTTITYMCRTCIVRTVAGVCCEFLFASQRSPRRRRVRFIAAHFRTRYDGRDFINLVSLKYDTHYTGHESLAASSNAAAVVSSSSSS